ncbi:ATP-dependent RNA helicase DHX30-like isoform X2 [Macrosteles quadrilineatus]|uniref:ATP-dependent RNA helicase DHX30-like isoform X2 n=1 Tax=Macrosteles quadrilineatus TaxID=74068 RepID=UPI0023E2FDA7|nr:ATP-dependent RNA helicase DHX30-like isoform X2 [Macrosteles quadrilineatus]
MRMLLRSTRLLKKKFQSSLMLRRVKLSMKKKTLIWKLIDALPIRREKKLFPHVADRRDGELFRRYERVKSRREDLSAALPIDKFRQEIINLVENNSFVVIKGEPGCGKSTQVPQYIFETFAADREATDCNIVVTQPRRISAISLAERVAYERDEQVGDVVGYHVRLYAKHPKYRDGYILFCSTGMLVQKMVSDAGLSGVTHVIVDEAHERDIPVDFLLLLLKRAQEQNPALKVIIMSATINAELFTKFFNDCPSISIPGFTFPVQHRFLDNELRTMLRRQGAQFEEEGDRPVVNIEAVLGMIDWIDRNKPDGAILVFLPGWLEIKTVMERLQELPNAEKFIVVPAHSKLSNDDQKRIFHVPDAGYRKVILSTNIAETSLTINDVVYVVDSGAVKEERMDLKTGLVCLDNQWASQANVRQRRGRAGRVKPGESYHLYTEDKYNSLEQFPTPEINRIPLTRSVLDVKMHTKDENISQFLSQLPEPPRLESVTQAVRVLQAMGALDEDENLTPLGKRIYKLPLDPYLSKALVHACLFKCVGPILSVVTVLSADYSLFENSLGLKSSMRQMKQKFSPSSDHIALARLYHQWEQLDWQDPSVARDDCREKGIVYKSMDRTRQLRSLHAELLVAARLVPEGTDVNDLSAPFNKFSPYDELLKSVLLTGLGKLLLSSQPTGRKKGITIRTIDGTPTIISSESVNSKFKELPTPFLTYFKSMSSTERRAIIVHESSLLSPLTVILFQPGVVTLKKMDGLEDDKSVIAIESSKPVNIIVGQKEGEQLLHLRQVIWNVLEYLVENQGSPRDLEQFLTISEFRDKLLDVLANITTEQGSNLDYTEAGELRTEPVYQRSYRG